MSIMKAQQEMPDAIKDHIMQGIAAFEASKTPADIDKALLEFNEAAKIAPDYPDVHYYSEKRMHCSRKCRKGGKRAEEVSWTIPWCWGQISSNEWNCPLIK